MNEIPKVNEERSVDKKFCKENKKIAEQKNARLLSYKDKSFCPLTFGLGYARIATTLTAKKCTFIGCKVKIFFAKF